MGCKKMIRLVTRIKESELISDFSSIKVDESEGKIYCSKSIDPEEKIYWTECALKYGIDVEFSDDNFGVVVTIEIENVKSISNVK